MSDHVIRYDGVDYPVTPDILSSVFRQINARAAQMPGTVFAQRIDEFLKGESSVIFFLGLGVGLTFKATTALARDLLGGGD